MRGEQYSESLMWVPKREFCVFPIVPPRVDSRGKSRDNRALSKWEDLQVGKGKLCSFLVGHRESKRGL